MSHRLGTQPLRHLRSHVPCPFHHPSLRSPTVLRTDRPIRAGRQSHLNQAVNTIPSSSSQNQCFPSKWQHLARRRHRNRFHHTLISSAITTRLTIAGPYRINRIHGILSWPRSQLYASPNPTCHDVLPRKEMVSVLADITDQSPQPRKAKIEPFYNFLIINVPCVMTTTTTTTDLPNVLLSTFIFPYALI